MTFFFFLWSEIKRGPCKGFWEGKLIARLESYDNPILDVKEKAFHSDFNWQMSLDHKN